MLRALLAAGCLLAFAPAAAAAPPVVTVSVSAAAGAAPLAVTLRAEGDAASYRWDLGDGSAAEGASVDHVYARPGRYVAVVTATAPTGETATAQVVVTAYALTLTAPAAATWGSAMRLTGTIRPAAAGARILLERGGHGVATATANARGEFAVRVRVGSPGAWTARLGDVVSAPRDVAVRPVLDARVDGSGVVDQPLRVVARLRPAGAGRIHAVVRRNGARVHGSAHGGSLSLRLPSGSPATVRVELRAEPADGFAPTARVLTTAVADPRLGPGSRGASVHVLERRLRELRYALRSVDGHYGHDTVEAVLAFQKVHGLPRTGRVDARVWRELRRASTPLPRHRGTHIEVSKGRNVVFVVRNDRVDSIVHVSTGATGNTPLGTWRIYRKVPGWDWVLWYPMYFLGGFAIHGYPSVPAYPASHGCVRVPMWIAPRLYESFGHGRLVRIYW